MHSDTSMTGARGLSMNYKNLNYEIETKMQRNLRIRLALTMNYKNLNYEIETGKLYSGAVAAGVSMNYKNLNYEIETRLTEV